MHELNASVVVAPTPATPGRVRRHLEVRTEADVSPPTVTAVAPEVEEDPIDIEAHAAANRDRLFEANILSLYAAAEVADEEGRSAQADLMRRRARRLALRFQREQ